MRGPGERLRQLLNIYDRNNSFEYDEQQFERRSSTERTIASPLDAVSGPLATSARKSGVPNVSRDTEKMESPESPTSTSTLQANGHRLPRPQVRGYRNETEEFSPQLDQDMNYTTRQSSLGMTQRIVDQGYRPQGNNIT